MGFLWEFSPRKRFPSFSLCSLTFPIPFLLYVANLFHMQVEADDTRFERDNKTNGKSRLTQGAKKKETPKREREHEKTKNEPKELED